MVTRVERLEEVGYGMVRFDSNMAEQINRELLTEVHLSANVQRDC